MKPDGLQALVIAAWLLITAKGCAADARVNAKTPGAPLRSEHRAVLSAPEAAKAIQACSRRHPTDLAGYWRPGRAELDRLELLLPYAFHVALARLVLQPDQKHPAPQDYVRQYAGFYRHGRRHIYVNAVERGTIERAAPTTWRTTAVRLCDGGLAGFGVLYDVEAGTFGPLEFDGRRSGPMPSR